MIKKILFLIAIVFSSSVFGTIDENSTHIDENSTHSDTICSQTECYKIYKELGEGVFGKVWEVENSKGERFAMKSYKKHEDNSWLAESPFADAEREFLRGQKLNHSHIVKTSELFKDTSDQENPTTYLVLELVEGKTLYNTPKKSLIDNTSLNACRQLVDALRYGFTEGYLYLDLHGNNIMLEDSLDTKVVDLASFYSFDEILAKVKGKVSEKALQKADVRGKKLEKFFQENPKILAEMQERMNDTNISKGVSVGDGTDQYKLLMPMFSYNLERITEICIYIITKSDLDRETKIQLFVEIKKLAWNYSEDTDEDLVIPMDQSLDELANVLSPS